MELELVERLTDAPDRWLVHAPGDDEALVLTVVDTGTGILLDETAYEHAPWVGFEHARIARLHATWRIDDTHLGFLSDDDRGPSLARAAEALADVPVDRERWVIAQGIALATALAAMAEHVPGFVHGELHRSFVAASGRARFRTPFRLVKARSTSDPRRLQAAFELLSPEVTRGRPRVPASDVFGLAAMLCAALGSSPFARESHFDTLQAIVAAPPRFPVLHAPGLARVLERALAKQLDARYPDAGAFAAALAEVVPDAHEYDEVISDRVAAWWPAWQPPAPPRAAACRAAWPLLRGTRTIRACTRCEQLVARESRTGVVLPLVSAPCHDPTDPAGSPEDGVRS